MITNLCKRTISIILAAMFLICIPFIAVADDNNGDDSKLPKWVTNFIEYYDLGQDRINYTKKLEYDDGRTVWTGTDSAGNKVTLIYDPDQNQLGVYQQTNRKSTTRQDFWTFGAEVVDGHTAHRRFGAVTPGTTDFAGNKGSDTKDDSQPGFTYKFYDQDCWYQIWNDDGHMTWKTWPHDSVYTEFSYDPETGRKSESVKYQNKDDIESNLGKYSFEGSEIFKGLKKRTNDTILDESIIPDPLIDDIVLLEIKDDKIPNDSSEHKAKVGTKRARTTNSKGALESETITTKNGQTYSYKTDVTNDNANGASDTQVMVITMDNMEIYYDKTDGHRTEIKYTNKYGSKIDISFDKNGKVTGVKKDGSETTSKGEELSKLFFETHDEYGVPFDDASSNEKVTFYDENEFYNKMAADVVYADATGYLMSGEVNEVKARALADGNYKLLDESDFFAKTDEIINDHEWNPKNTGTKKFASGGKFKDRLCSNAKIFSITWYAIGHVFSLTQIINRSLAGALWKAQTK